MGVSCFTVGNLKPDLHIGAYQRFIFGDPILPEPLASFKLDNIYVPTLTSPSLTNSEMRNNTLSGFRWIQTTSYGDTTGQFKLQSFVDAQPTGTDLLIFNNDGTMSFSSSYIPTTPSSPATKAYVDSKAFGSIPWIRQTTSTTMSTNTYYVADSASMISFTLPTTANFGDVFQITGRGSGGWEIIQNSGQKINYGDMSTTIGVSGGLQSTNKNDSISLVCIDSSEFIVYSSIGNITFY